MPDIDASTAGDAHSRRMLVEHFRAEHTLLEQEMLAKFLRDNPQAGEGDIRAFADRLAGRRAA